MEPLTASAIATLAFTKIFEKTLEKFTEAALAKLDELRKKIWDKLRSDSRAETALTAVEQGNESELERVKIYLEDAMRSDPQFAEQVQLLAQEIDAGKLQDNSSMTQNNHDNSTGYQTKVETESGTTNIGNHTHNYH
jgi:low affinity Fe/Cu permease